MHWISIFKVRNVSRSAALPYWLTGAPLLPPPNSLVVWQWKKRLLSQSPGQRRSRDRVLCRVGEQLPSVLVYDGRGLSLRLLLWGVGPAVVNVPPSHVFLDQQFLTRPNFAFPSSFLTSRDIWQCPEPVLVVTTGMCCWHLKSVDQRCC